jgi:hypothetical protein
VLIATGGLVYLAAWLDARAKTAVPALQMAPTPFNTAVMAAVPSVHRPYRPTPGLTNGHIETIFASLNRSCPDVNYRREFLHTADGGIVTMDWEHFGEGEEDLPEDAPVLILLPGLTGGSGEARAPPPAVRASPPSALSFQGRP